MKKRFRFSLRMVLILLALVAVFLAWQADVASRRSAALRVLREVESVLPKPSGPLWLGKFIGDEYVCRIKDVGVQHSLLSNEHLEVLSKVPELRTVSTNQMRAGTLVAAFEIAGGIGATGENALISDVGIEAIARAEKLEALILFNTVATNEGISHLRKLRKLKMLLIASPNITDESVQHFSKLQSLERLWVPAKISAEGVEQLRRALPNCEVITRESEDSVFLSIDVQ